MKVGIVTLTGYWNYGNRLQNLALKTVIENKFNKDVTTVRTWQAELENGRVHSIRHLLSLVKHRKLFSTLRLRKRVETFKIFSDQFLNESGEIATVDNYVSLLENFDKVVVGSDQVWNPEWLSDSELDFFLLAGIRNDKRISYAASFGVDNVDAYASSFERELPKFSAISVREQTGVDIVSGIGHSEATLVLDPTMLLTKSDWEKLADTQEWSSKGYVFEYFLGPKSDVTNMAEKKITNIVGQAIAFNNPDHHSKQYYDESPLNFVNGIRNAKVVITDSFHAAVFALMFGIPVFIAERSDAKLGSRLVTLFGRIGRDVPLVSQILEEDYEIPEITNGVDEELAKYREASMQFLRKSLNNGLKNS